MPRSLVYFVGVSTGQSRVTSLFPSWAEALGIDADLAGKDLAVNAPRGVFRGLLKEISSDAHVTERWSPATSSTCSGTAGTCLRISTPWPSCAGRWGASPSPRWG